MTPRERLQAAATGRPVDRKPSLSTGPNADGLIVTSIQRIDPSREWAVLLEVPSLFAQRPVGVMDLLDKDPKEADRLLSKAVDRIAAQIEMGIEAGADGIFYRLVGASPEHMSPMSYGGHFLDLDRELLGHAQNALFNVVYVEGGEGAYLDFVSDLPSQAFGWDVKATGVPVEQVRKLHAGALVTSTPEGDVLLSDYLPSPVIKGEQAIGSSL